MGRGSDGNAAPPPAPPPAPVPVPVPVPVPAGGGAAGAGGGAVLLAVSAAVPLRPLRLSALRSAGRSLKPRPLSRHAPLSPAPSPARPRPAPNPRRGAPPAEPKTRGGAGMRRGGDPRGSLFPSGAPTHRCGESLVPFVCPHPPGVSPPPSPRGVPIPFGMSPSSGVPPIPGGVPLPPHARWAHPTHEDLPPPPPPPPPMSPQSHSPLLALWGL